MNARLCLYFKNKLWEDYHLGQYKDLEDFIEKIHLPAEGDENYYDMDYSKFTIKFYNTPIRLWKNLGLDTHTLKDFLQSHELDAIFDWSNFVAQNESEEDTFDFEFQFEDRDDSFQSYEYSLPSLNEFQRVHLESATFEYIFHFGRWDREDFISRYIGGFKDFEEFCSYYIKENDVDFDYAIPYFSYGVLGRKLYSYYNLKIFTFESLSKYRQALNLPPNGYKYTDEVRNGGFIGDYEDYEDFEYKEDEKKEKQFQDFIKKNQWKIDLAEKPFFIIGKSYIKNHYGGDIEEFLDDPDCPWDLGELLNSEDFAESVCASEGYFYEEEDEGIFVFRK